MANYPSQLRERDELNLRLGIKSSLSQLRSVIASLYVIYVANDKQAQVTYSKESINGSLTSIKLEDNLAQQIDTKFPAAEKISSLVNKTPLFTAQLEALQVGIELFFHLAKINFVASGLSERTGSSRFQKKLAFATNMILVDLYLSSHSSEDVSKLLAAWLEDKPFASKLEDGLKMLLNTFTEETQYKIRDNNLDEIVFNQEGVYDTVLNEGEAISKDGNEPVGPFRIYKSYVASGMHPYLIEQKQEFKLNGSVSRADLENYAQLVSTALDITPRKTTIEREVAEQPHKQQQSSNLLLFQFDDATKFVWECIKLFNKNKELKQLLSSDYRSNGGSTGNYLRINSCFVAQLGQIDIEGFESIYTDEEGYINNGFDAREVDKFAIAVNDVFAGRYKVVIEDNNFKLFKIVALDEPRQQIFFGAPGTGKSYRVEQITEQYGDDVIRTTFHPDSDYSTFVGCYKPTMQELQGELTDQPILDYDSLVDKFKEYLNVPNANITKACTLFGYHYHNSIVRMQEQGRRITDLVNDAYKSNTSYDSVVRGGMACYEEERYIPASKTEIAYSFVPQAFTQAYTRAWLNPSRPIFLVIEELNRGNCAQIFGDIFQLLDRNDKNESAYSIIPDNDLQKHLADQFKDADNIPADIQSGLKMRLPSNLYIWATMNTSDQSLFPIDSAFKRRWIWKYIPIANAELDYKIQVGDKQYDWWSFVEKVNNEIEGATKSEDKKLGYFFAKAENGIIPADTFVSKVVFYLWNDVFKDSYDKTIFKDGLTFHRFFEPNGDPKLEIIDTFLHDLDLKAIGEE